MVAKKVTLIACGIVAAVAASFGLSALRDVASSYTEATPKRSTHDFEALALEKRPADVLDFPFSAEDGQAQSLTQFAGKVRVVNLWATWCAPCVVEMPALAALAAKLQNPDFKLITVSVDRNGAPHVRKWIDARNLDLEIFTAPAGQFPNAYLPTTWVLDRQGRVVWVARGAKDWSSPYAIAMLQGILDEPKP